MSKDDYRAMWDLVNLNVFSIQTQLIGDEWVGPGSIFLLTNRNNYYLG